MKLDDFLSQRMKEKKFFNLNGYNDDNPQKNGQYAVLKQFINSFQLFVDIGAHVGDFSRKLISLRKDLDILVFEPNPNLSSKLKKSFSNFPTVKIYSVALSNRKGKSKLYIHASNFGASSLFKRTEMMPSFQKKMKSVGVTVYTLDEYYNEISSKAKKKGCFIKIDTEGADLLVLKGARKILQRPFPLFVMFEYSPEGWRESKQTLKEALHYVESLEFNIFRILPLGLEQVRYFSQEMENFGYCNYLIIKNFKIENIFNLARKVATRDGFSSFYPYS